MNWINAIIQAIIAAFVKPQPSPTPPPSPGNWESRLLFLHNQARQQAGLGMLYTNSVLHTTATNHSQWMHNNNRMTHDENGVPFSTRLINAGYHWRNAGENIAYGYNSPDAVFQAWMSDEGHRQNILDGDFKDVGFGMVGNYWTADFGSTASRLTDAGTMRLPGGVSCCNQQ